MRVLIPLDSYINYRIILNQEVKDYGELLVGEMYVFLGKNKDFYKLMPLKESLHDNCLLLVSAEDFENAEFLELGVTKKYGSTL